MDFAELVFFTGLLGILAAVIFLLILSLIPPNSHLKDRELEGAISTIADRLDSLARKYAAPVMGWLWIPFLVVFVISAVVVFVRYLL